MLSVVLDVFLADARISPATYPDQLIRDILVDRETNVVRVFPPYTGLVVSESF